MLRHNRRLLPDVNWDPPIPNCDEPKPDADDEGMLDRPRLFAALALPNWAPRPWPMLEPNPPVPPISWLLPTGPTLPPRLPPKLDPRPTPTSLNPGFGGKIPEPAGLDIALLGLPSPMRLLPDTFPGKSWTALKPGRFPGFEPGAFDTNALLGAESICEESRHCWPEQKRKKACAKEMHLL